MKTIARSFTAIFKGRLWRAIFLILLAIPFRASAESALETISVRSPAIPADTGGSGDSGIPILSSDGRFVLFASSAPDLVLNADNHSIPKLFPARLNVYLRDRQKGLTELISADVTGTAGGNENSLPIRISTNGEFVLFESTAENLVADDTNGLKDVFLRNRTTGTTLLVSRSIDGSVGNGVSGDAMMTPDGRFVAFVSAANNLTVDDTNGISDIFVRDLVLQTTTLASVNAQSAFGASEHPELTPDGRFVAFRSTAPNLVSGVTNQNQIYVRDLLNAKTYCASTNAKALLQSVSITGSPVAFDHRISNDGNGVAFALSASGSGRALVVLHHLAEGISDIIATNAISPIPGTESNVQDLEMSPDGRFIAFICTTNNSAQCIRLWDSQTGKAQLVSGTLNNAVPFGTLCRNPQLDSTGRYVAFLCNASGLTTNVIADGFHLYLRDTLTATTRLVDASPDGSSPGLDYSVVPTLSDDGNLVAFESADGLIADDPNKNFDVFVRDESTQSLELISAHHPDLSPQTPNGTSFIFNSCVSSNGQFVTFASDADNLVPGDTNGLRDIFVRDRLAGINVLVSAGTNGESANGISSEPVISGNGRYVAFTSHASNLANGDTNRSSDVFVRDIQSGVTYIASKGSNGGDVGNSDSFSPSISSDGRFVLFQSAAKNLAPGIFSGVANLFLHDTTDTNQALTTSGVAAATMAADGKWIAFIGNGQPTQSLKIWNTAASKYTYTNANLSSFGAGVSISENGERLSYVAISSGNSVLFVTDPAQGINRIVTTRVPVDNAGRLSGNGRFLVYSSPTPKTANDTNGLADVYLYDFDLATNVLLSRTTSGSVTLTGASDSPEITRDGRFVAYRCEASDLIHGDSNGVPDIVLYDRANDVTTLISVNRYRSGSANDRALFPQFSADGSTLLWTSWASDQGPGDQNPFADVFAFRLVADPLSDSDDDGMDDQWELDHFLTKDRDGTDDFDDDGASDLFEFQTGTNPDDSNSLFRGTIIFSTSPSAHAQLTWPAAPGKAYRVQWKDSLSDAEWHDLDASASVLGVTATAIDSAPSPSRWYRIALILP